MPRKLKTPFGVRYEYGFAISPDTFWELERATRIAGFKLDSQACARILGALSDANAGAATETRPVLAADVKSLLLDVATSASDLSDALCVLFDRASERPTRGLKAERQIPVDAGAAGYASLFLEGRVRPILETRSPTGLAVLSDLPGLSSALKTLSEQASEAANFVREISKSHQPKRGWLTELIIVLAEEYSKVSGKRPGFSRTVSGEPDGPLFRFVKAALALLVLGIRNGRIVDRPCTDNGPAVLQITARRRSRPRSRR